MQHVRKVLSRFQLAVLLIWLKKTMLSYFFCHNLKNSNNPNHIRRLCQGRVHSQLCWLLQEMFGQKRN